MTIDGVVKALRSLWGLTKSGTLSTSSVVEAEIAERFRALSAAIRSDERAELREEVTESDCTCVGCQRVLDLLTEDGLARRPLVRSTVYRYIDGERLRQASLHKGESCADDVDEFFKLAVLVEELGEVGRALLEGQQEQVLSELVQVAASSVAWLEFIFARGGESDG